MYFYSSSTTTTTTTSTSSKKPTSRMNARNVQRQHRPKSKKNSATSRNRSTPSSLLDRGNMSAVSLPLSMNSLADLDHPENLNNMESDESSSSSELLYICFSI